MKALMILAFSIVSLAATPITPTTTAPTPVPTESSYVLPDILHAQLWGDHVFLVHASGSIVMAIADLEIVQPFVLNSAGYPGVQTSTPIVSNPSDLTLTYSSSVGTITVHTPCKGMSELRCAEKFKKQVDATQRIFPKLP